MDDINRNTPVCGGEGWEARAVDDELLTDRELRAQARTTVHVRGREGGVCRDAERSRTVCVCICVQGRFEVQIDQYTRMLLPKLFLFTVLSSFLPLGRAPRQIPRPEAEGVRLGPIC